MDGVIYMMVGTKHAEHLVVSLYSLLEHWDGEIAILADDRGAEFCRPMRAIPQVRIVQFDFNSMTVDKPGSGKVYLAKTSMHHLSPFDRSVFLDADTLVAGDIRPVFPEDDELRITQWMEWTSLGKMMSGRIREWQQAAPCEVDIQLADHWAAINTGVIGFSKKCLATMDDWREMTARNVRFICDEIAMQLIFPEYPCLVLDDRYNCSPCYSETWIKHGVDPEMLEGLDRYYVDHESEPVRVIPEDVVGQLRQWSGQSQGRSNDVSVWHGHGFKFVKKPLGRAVWWPVYQKTIEENFCGIADWTPWHSGKANGQRWRGCKLLRYVSDPAHAFQPKPKEEHADAA